MSPSDHRHDGQDAPRAYPAETARGTRIVLKTPARRIIFFGGLVALVLFILFTKLTLL